ncbi:MAG: hypothetical protein A2Z91_00325 [Deltaproteobacteria bacterium GWA2_38_16]|nr:MAG: hypothetical protein A2Z91_00325 [Deltaproteobacteria bacterium GWA2_38_16]OGQ03548.1 MAG: hypothetical protein A3D19_01730 [Deltaproteobacteria bacterium RIFCSPHIGHO2_02_FULL_38_15]OGQ33270.1 MAG: hypothetical protein A3A72_04835 [Deltaproteobacteria bacterium RIFCSPLOWO2_01_FULL_38_9]OGQ59479.1 MAG: hypothetical protein A3G92_02570 [Deltaproteobacteria bacterium RIFCSPLOWO2_12_FULL_38_8]HBQ21210.1 hypothetical protein [Deltaproteobacteria bacterium]
MKKIFSPLVVLAFLLQTTFLFALPKYSLQEKKRCYSCHFNKNGGGPLNKEGKYYSEHRSFEPLSEKVVKKVIVAKKEQPQKEKTKKEAVEKVIPEVEIIEEKPSVVAVREVTLLDKTNLSADISMAFMVSESKTDPQNFYLMKAEPLVTTQVAKNFLTVFGYNFAAPILTAYGQYSFGKSYVQLGSFHIPFGLDVLDYNNVISTYIKENYDLALDTRDVGVEIGSREDFYGRVVIANGARDPRDRSALIRPSFDRDLGYLIDGGYQGIFYTVPFLLGASYLVEKRIPPGLPVRGIPSNPTSGLRAVTQLFGLYGQLNYKKFGMLGEFAFGRHTPVRGDRSYGFYLKPFYNIQNNWNAALRAELFARDRQFLGDSLMRYVLSTEYQFSKYVSIEPMYRINLELGNLAHVKNNDAIVLLAMKF